MSNIVRIACLKNLNDTFKKLIDIMLKLLIPLYKFGSHFLLNEFATTLIENKRIFLAFFTPKIVFIVTSKTH
jgi:hypothetical protein